MPTTGLEESCWAFQKNMTLFLRTSKFWKTFKQRNHVGRVGKGDSRGGQARAAFFLRTLISL